MMAMPLRRAILSGALLLVTGCGGGSAGTSAPPPDARAKLEEVGEVYRVYSDSHKKPPASLKDMIGNRPAGPAGVKALEDGEVVLNYGAAMTDTNEGPASTPSDKVLAFEKKAPESGGLVLLLDRTVKPMTADEFKAAPKAGK